MNLTLSRVLNKMLEKLKVQKINYYGQKKP